MSFPDKFAELFRRILPSPFSIAIVLTLITFLLATVCSRPQQNVSGPYLLTLMDYWYLGFWDSPLLVFAIQMMLILVLGHILALSKPIEALLDHLAGYCTNTPRAAAIVCFLTLVVSFFNWGLCLVFGAIFARKVAERASLNGTPVNYPLIGAAGYSGMMAWHGGISGSAPLKVAEQGHFLQDSLGIISQEETIFSAMNLSVSLTLLTLLPIFLFLIGRNSRGYFAGATFFTIPPKNEVKAVGAEKIDHSGWFSKLIGAVILVYVLHRFYVDPQGSGLAAINPNLVNMLLFGLGIFLHRNIKAFLEASDKAIGGATGILIQFPFYFGIMGVMKYSGLTQILSDYFISISTAQGFPILTMASAGIVNLFVPSGGGQWAVQGPIIAEATLNLGVPPGKAVMALAYGDQLTNMLQPFWAIPLLGITGLKAKEILPYTILIMFLGLVVFSLGLLLF